MLAYIDSQKELRDNVVSELHKYGSIGEGKSIAEILTNLQRAFDMHNIYVLCEWRCLTKQMLQWDVDWERVSLKLVEIGWVDGLKWFMDNGKFFSEHACEYATQLGNLDILKYLCENGASYGTSTCFTANKFRHQECLAYLCEQLDMPFSAMCSGIEITNGAFGRVVSLSALDRLTYSV